MLVGNDIAYPQGQVDWDLYSKNSNFAFIRASYGDGFVDNQFTRNQSEARRVNMYHGYYHYAYPQYNMPQAEADWFLKTVGPLQEKEFLALDFEEQYAGDKVQWCLSFLNHISSSLNSYKPLLYINASLMDSLDWTPVVNGGFGLWLANWTGDPVNTGTIKYWPVVAFNQWTDAQSVPGITTKVDGDAFQGDYNALSAYGFKPVPPPPPAPTPDKYKLFSLYVKQIVNGPGMSWTKIDNIKKTIIANGI